MWGFRIERCDLFLSIKAEAFLPIFYTLGFTESSMAHWERLFDFGVLRFLIFLRFLKFVEAPEASISSTSTWWRREGEIDGEAVGGGGRGWYLAFEDDMEGGEREGRDGVGRGDWREREAWRRWWGVMTFDMEADVAVHVGCMGEFNLFCKLQGYIWSKKKFRGKYDLCLNLPGQIWSLTHRIIKTEGQNCDFASNPNTYTYIPTFFFILLHHHRNRPASSLARRRRELRRSLSAAVVQVRRCSRRNKAPSDEPEPFILSFLTSLIFVRTGLQLR